MLNSTELEISTAHKTEIMTSEEMSCFKSLKSCLYHANNVKIAAIVGILTLMIRINFVLA